MKTTTREWCNCCNNYSPVSFHVPDEIWNEVTMGKFQRLCIMCFAKRADERLIDWSKEIIFFPFSLVSEIQYPRTMDNKVRVCVLCGHTEETNELPEESLYDKYSRLHDELHKNKCTLTDQELLEAVSKVVTEMCINQKWQMTVPPDMNRDSDMLISELENRFRILTEYNQTKKA